MKAGDVPLHDTRAPEQFTGAVKSPQARVPGTIPGAAHLELTAFYSAADHRFQDPDAIRALAAQAGIPADGGPITFCNTGHQASVSWFALSELAGLPGVRLYDGSMSEWTADPAHPVQTGVEPGAKGGVRTGGGAAG
ncbi:sulfurtransferase [Azospirillum thermophilum]|uniref:sulfurtransferase n=1 Tax=Azospirillum thermophilum TaxID=2202148 RepID=UPI001FE8BDF8|nr:rhodanese-like domain-containing protein [Azospirillum thermophilum]